jgi:hypothetical protein
MSFTGSNRGSETRGGVDQTTESVPQHGLVKVDEESNGQLLQFEVRNDLGLVHRQEPLYGFHFDDKAVFDHEIEPISTIECKAFVLEW